MTFSNPKHVSLFSQSDDFDSIKVEFLDSFRNGVKNFDQNGKIISSMKQLSSEQIQQSIEVPKI